MLNSTTSKPRKKVSTLTFHNGINHGGFFQALCLSKYIEELGYDVTVINYKNRTHWKSELKAFLFTKRPVRFYKNLRKVFSFKKQVAAYMNLEPKKLTLDTSRLKKIVSQKDYLVIGSDIVWDYEYPMLGDNDVFFANDLEPRKAILSYAASAGRAKSQLPQKYADALHRFKIIGVRDDNTADLVAQATKRKAIMNIDPTFLLPIDKQEEILEVSNSVSPTKPYLLIYAFYLPNKMIRKISDYCKRKGLLIIVVGYQQNIDGSIDMTHVGPRDWLCYFKHADYVITSTFHGTIYSILYKKKFLTFGNSAVKFKVTSLLNHLREGRSYIDGSDSTSANNLDLESLFERQLDYDYANLENVIKESKTYLKTALETTAP